MAQSESQFSGEAKQETIVLLEVPPGQHAAVRLDIYITQFVENATRAKVQRAIRDGRVNVNGRPARASYVVQPGDRIECVFLRPPPIEARPEPIPLDILYEDDHLIIVNKPAGMVVHPAYGNRTGTLVNALLHHVGGRTLTFEDEEDEDELGKEEDIGLSTIGAAPRHEDDPSIRPGLVHRLDKDTSGLMVIAKDDIAHALLARQFAERTIERAYVAIVWGHPNPPRGRIETLLGRDPRDRKRMAVVAGSRGKRAVTNYDVTKYFRHTAMVEFKLESGRTHQIRVHARHIGHPVLGDATYGGERVPAQITAGHERSFYSGLLSRQALHARSLGFTHPCTEEWVFFESDPPEDMKRALEALRRNAKSKAEAT